MSFILRFEFYFKGGRYSYSGLSFIGKKTDLIRGGCDFLYFEVVRDPETEVAQNEEGHNLK